MNKEELIGKMQLVYFGDRNALNEMIGYYDGLKEVIEMVQKENNQLKDSSKELLNKFAKKDRVLKELRSWLEDQQRRSWDEVSDTFGYVLDKLLELEAEHEQIK